MLKFTNSLNSYLNLSISMLNFGTKYTVVQKNIRCFYNLAKTDNLFHKDENRLNPIMITNLNDYKNYSSKKLKGNKISKPKVELRKEEIDEVINYDDLIDEFKKANEKLKNDLKDNFNLRLTPSSFEQLIVKTSDGNMKLGEITQVEVKSPTLYQINMIDTPDYVKQVYEAIQKSNLNVNAQLDKTTINLSISKVTREKREDLARNIKLKCEQALKKMREMENRALRQAKENKKVSSDLSYNVSQHVKYQFDLYSKQACDMRDSKIKEILKD